MCQENCHDELAAEFAKCSRVILEHTETEILEDLIEDDPATSTFIEHKDDFLRIYSLVNSFDNGHRVVEHVRSLLPKELVRNEIIENIKASENKNEDEADEVVGYSDEEVKMMFRQIYYHIDSEYFSTKVGDLLARRLSFDPSQNDHIVDEQLHGGATAITALIIRNRLYIANCGNNIGLLVKEIGNEISLFVVSQQHENHDDFEMKRIQNLGLDPRIVKNPTRCFGDYFRKGGYKENKLLQEAKSEPVIVEPTIVGGVNVDDSFRFLLFVSPSVIKAIHIIKPSVNVNEMLASLILEEIKESQSLKDVAKNVLDQIANLYDGALKLRLHPGQQLNRELMSMLFIPLVSNMVQKLDNEDDQEVREQKLLSTTGGESNDCVQPYVDFAEFESSELRDTVLAKIESLKQYYQERKSMHSIEEED